MSRSRSNSSKSSRSPARKPPSRSGSPSPRSKSLEKRNSRDRSRSRERQSRRRSYSNEQRGSQRRGPDSSRDPRNIPKSNKLFVTNIDSLYDQNEVRKSLDQQFGKFGSIKQIIVKTKRGSPNSYAFLEFATERDAEAAHDGMKGQVFKGKELKVEFSKGQRKFEDRRGDKCYICHKEGHFARDCRYRDRSRDHEAYRGSRYRERSRSDSRDRHYRSRRDSRDYDRRYRYSRSRSPRRNQRRYSPDRSRDYRRRDRPDYRQPERRRDYNDRPERF